MSGEDEKAKAELAVFEDFVRFRKLPIDLDTVEKRKPPAPDLRCVHATEGALAVELVELCDSNLASAFANPTDDGTGVQYIRTSDPSRSILSKKLKKRYVTDCPIWLLCYTAGRIITPRDVILPTIRPLLASYRHTFVRAWLFTEDGVDDVWTEAKP